MKKNNLKITVVGSGYVGMSMSVLLSQNNQVTVYDIDDNKVKNLQDVSRYIRTSTGNNIKIIIQRYSVNKEILVQPNVVIDDDNLIKKKT